MKIKMKMWGYFSMALLIIMPSKSFCKIYPRFLVYINNGILLSKYDHHSVDGSPTHADVSNTFRQGIGIKYTKITASSVLLSCGFEIGYDKYAAKINYPFIDYGFYPPIEDRAQYDLNALIPYTQVEINLGYRFGKMQKIRPEFRLGHTLRVPLKSENLRYYSYERDVNGLIANNMTSYGSYGKSFKHTLVFEILNYLYIGLSLPASIKKAFLFSKIGLQYQRQILFRNNQFNYFNISYYDLWGVKKGEEEFKGTHSSINILLGVEF